ncbi:MAG: transcriptional repressor [Actinomycetota bacterium]|nr:transcriptional repressor [Actinomycetota bacterium]
MGDERIAELIESLRRRGERVTTARRALLGALAGADRHLSADELAAEVHRLHPDVHRATVYRSLDTLTQLGLVEHSHLGHGAAVYHLADDVHQHLVCEDCGAVIEVPPELFSDVAGDLRRRYGFEISSRHFALVGRCRSCAATARAALP